MQRHDGSNILEGVIPFPPARRTRDPVRRPARVARMLSLAHHLANAINEGQFASAADIACQYGFSRNRIATLLRLTGLAPDIQEEVLYLESVDGDEPMTERWLFEAIARNLDWNQQRLMWAERMISNGAARAA